MVFEIVLPDRDDRPAEALQIVSFTLIAGDVAVEFGLPEFGVVLWQRVIALRAAVPEAAVDEDGELFADEGDIGADGSYHHVSFAATTPQAGGEFDFVVKTIAAEAGVPEGFAEEEFGPTILSPVGAHYAGDGFALGRGGSFVADVFDGLILPIERGIG